MLIKMYCTAYCPYCIRAKQLLNAKGVTYDTIDIDVDYQKRGEMETLSGGTSVPQIFINDFHVGGYDELAALNHTGELDDLLKEK